VAFPYDPNGTNQALSKLGYDYQLPGATPTAVSGTTAPFAGRTEPQAPVAPPPQPAPAPTVTVQAAPAPAPTNDPGAPKSATDGDAAAPAASGNGLGSVKDIAAGISSMKTDDKKSNQGFQKVGALIGTVLSAYTGNAAGVAGGVSSMQGASK
jgi:hypothetical protein